MPFNIIELLKTILIGIVEGITEWLPISSTGHMLIVDRFIHLEMPPDFKEMYFVVIQLGAIIAVVVMFFKMMNPFGFGKNQKPTVKKPVVTVWLKVLTACVPSAIIGIITDKFIEKYLHTTEVIAAMLIIYGVIFIVVEFWNKRRTPKMPTLADIDYKTAFLIGLFQTLSFIPGTSRSGATIVGALVLGASRVASAEFTFFLAVPSMLGASIYKLMQFGSSFTPFEFFTLAVGMITAFVVSLFVIRYLMNYIKKHDFTVFGWYRIVLGILLVVLCLRF